MRMVHRYIYLRKFTLGLLLGILVSLLYHSYCYKTIICISKTKFSKANRTPSKNIPHESKNSEINRKLLYVGVLTANKFITTRGKSVYETWGRQISGKIEFFTSEFSTPWHDIPLVRLKGVDDTYPPQKKSFLAIKYMFDHYINDYEYFLRADDDVYIRPERLEKFLRSINSSESYYIGQPGRGNEEEFGYLSLKKNENYCMGGTGVIFSRAALKKLGPHLKYCIKNLKSTHEDVEIGRCVKNFVGISCTWAYEMQDIFYSRYSTSDHSTSLIPDDAYRAITIHSIKNHTQLRLLHNYVQSLSIMDKESNLRNELREISRFSKLLQIPSPSFDKPSIGIFVDHLASEASLNHWKPRNESEIIAWDFFRNTAAFELKHPNPKHRINLSTRIAFNSTISALLRSINKFQKERGRVLKFKEMLYGYWRVNPSYSVDFVLDLFMLYRKYEGKKMTLPVRRHAYVQSFFGPLYLTDESESDSSDTAVNEVPSESFFGILKTVFEEKSEYLFGKNMRSDRRPERITFILPLLGRIREFHRFLENYKRVCVERGENTRLVLVIHAPSKGVSDTRSEMALAVRTLLRNFPTALITVIWSEEPFSRGRSLNEGSLRCSSDDLLLFIDVDMVFTAQLLDKIRLHTVKAKQVYFPIVFSEFLSQLNFRHDIHQQTDSAFDLSDRRGYWREYGFGMVSIYHCDFTNIGGFNHSISGWGKEDVDLYDKVIQHSSLRVFRSPDSSLLHVAHPIVCGEDLTLDQFKMCKGSQITSLVSPEILAQMFFQDEKLFSFARNRSKLL